jgi:hypothetical protein
VSHSNSGPAEIIATAFDTGGRPKGMSPTTLTAPRDFLSPRLPIVPTGRREFARSDRLTVFFRIYQGVSRVALGSRVTGRAIRFVVKP